MKQRPHEEIVKNIKLKYRVYMNTITDTDIIVSLGGACRPAGHLRKKELRFFSAPLDWMCEYSLETALHLFKTKFETFFLEKEIIKQPSEGTNYVVKDTANKIVSIHHFPVSEDIDEFYNSNFRKSMLRRFWLLNFVIKKSKHITFLCNRQDSPDVICKALLEFGVLYSHCNIMLINIRTITSTVINERIEVRLSEKLTYIEYSFEDSNKYHEETSEHNDDWLGNVEKWEEILSFIRLPRNIRVLYLVCNAWINRGHIFRCQTKRLLKYIGLWESLHKYRKYFP